MPPAPVKVYLNNPTQFSLNVWWQELEPLAPGAKLLLEVRQFPGSWDAARVVTVEEPAKGSLVVGDLLPTSAYEVRAYSVEADGTRSDYSNVTSGDTLPVGCGGGPDGKGKDKKCVIS